jgi:hypothetical protein
MKARKLREHAPSSSRKIARTFRLTSGKVETAQEILGASTATEAIETALDLVIFRKELTNGARRAFGIKIEKPD